MRKSMILIDFIYSGLLLNPLECTRELADALRALDGTEVNIIGTCEDKKEDRIEQLRLYLNKNKTRLGEYGVF